jgi:hypothetical protein
MELGLWALFDGRGKRPARQMASFTAKLQNKPASRWIAPREPDASLTNLLDRDSQKRDRDERSLFFK